MTHRTHKPEQGPQAPTIRYTGCFPGGIPVDSAAPFARLDYAAELELKERALELFWERCGLGIERRKINATPQPRAYRTTSKRRVTDDGTVCRLSIGDDAEGAALLEPAAHGALFAAAQGLLARDDNRRLAKLLNWIIIRDNGHRDRVLILNVARANATIAREARAFAEAVGAAAKENVAGAILFRDPTRSDFYLEQTAGGGDDARTLYGRDTILMEIAGRRYSSPALAFTQVSREAAGVLALCLQELVSGPRFATAPLVDVYCGYGLFAGFLDNGRRPRIVGIDANDAGIRAARRNQPRGHFECDGVSARSLERMAQFDGEIQVVDPPRGGLPYQVVQALAGRRPALSLNCFCDIDQMPQAIRDWAARGYRAELAIPVDMFAGCAALEMIVAFLPETD